MLSKKTIVFYLLLAFSLACSNERVIFEKNDYKITINSMDDSYKGYRYYHNGSLALEEELNQEYKIDGISKSYYENGVVKMIQTYANGIKHGPEIVYYPSGNMEYKGQYDSSKMDGVWYWYSDTSKSVEFDILANYLNGKYFGSQVEIDSVSLKPIVRFYNFDELIGVLKDDMSGLGRNKVDGDLVFCMYNKNHFEVGDVFDLTIFLGHGSDTDIDLKMKIINEEDEENISPSVLKVHDYMSKVNWSLPVKKTAILNIEVNMLEKDKILYQSTLNIPLTIN